MSESMVDESQLTLINVTTYHQTFNPDEITLMVYTLSRVNRHQEWSEILQPALQETKP